MVEDTYNALSRHAHWLITWAGVQLFCLVLAFYRPAISGFEFLGIILGGVTSFGLWMLLGSIRRYIYGGLLAWCYSAGVAVFIMLLLSVSGVLYLWFGEFLSSDFLRFGLDNQEFVWSWTGEYLWGWLGFAMLAIFGAVTSLWMHVDADENLYVDNGKYALLGGLMLLAGAFGGQVYRPWSFTSPEASLFKAVAGMFEQSEGGGEGLHSANRFEFENAETQSRFDVLFLINETWDREYCGFCSGQRGRVGMPFLTEWVRAERRDGRAFVFEQAFANATASDVSYPSILTGVGTYESGEKFHRMPLAWQLGDKAGMETLVGTPQDWNWASFDDFFLSTPPDTYFTAKQLGGAIINDVGVDEIEGARRFASAVKKVEPDQRLFAVYASNALHEPYQTDSPHVDESCTHSDEYFCAKRLLDESIKTILRSFQESGRLERSIVVMTGDHGRFLGDGETSSRRIPKLYSFYDSAVRVPLVIRLPDELQEDMPEEARALEGNTKRNVANVDLVPTLAHLLRVTRSQANHTILSQLVGASLTQPVDTGRKIVSVNTNDLRHWEREGFGIYWRDKRFVASTVEGFGLYDIQSDPDQSNNLWDGADRDTIEVVYRMIRQHSELKRIYQNIIRRGHSDN